MSKSVNKKDTLLVEAVEHLERMLEELSIVDSSRPFNNGYYVGFSAAVSEIKKEFLEKKEVDVKIELSKRERELIQKALESERDNLKKTIGVSSESSPSMQVLRAWVSAIDNLLEDKFSE